MLKFSTLSLSLVLSTLCYASGTNFDAVGRPSKYKGIQPGKPKPPKDCKDKPHKHRDCPPASIGIPIFQGNVPFKGSMAPVYVEVDSVTGATLKYLLLSPNSRLALADYIRLTFEEHQATFGNFDEGLYEKLKATGRRECLRVRINYRLAGSPAEAAIFDNAKQMTSAQFAVLTSTRFSRCMKKFKCKPCAGEMVRDSIHNILEVNLTPKSIESLKYDPEIERIDLIPDSLTPGNPHADLNASFGASFPGINLAPICVDPPVSFPTPQSCGEKIRIGVVEPGYITLAQRNLYLNGTWFHPIAPLPTLANNSFHAVWMCAIIRNSIGDALFEKGGSANTGNDPQVGGIFFVNKDQGRTGGGTILAIDSVGPHVINESWAYDRWDDCPNLGINPPALQRELEWRIEKAVGSLPFSTFVVSAGNGGAGSPDHLRCLAQITGCPLNLPEECEEVSYFNHNAIIVGSANADGSAISSFSSWRNNRNPASTYRDEAPHIVAKGEMVELPWMTPYDVPLSFDIGEPALIDRNNRNSFGQIGGTSVAAATITAMAADLMDNFITLERYPEVIRVILMASATKPTSWGESVWPDKGGGPDMRAGAGVPNGAVAFQIASNFLNDGVFNTPTTDPLDGPGFFRFMFPTGSAGGTITKTITTTTSRPETDIWITWVQDPGGYVSTASDLDLSVSESSPLPGTSALNTTEHVKVPASINLSYTITITLKTRGGGAPNAPIFGACAIRPN